MFDLFKKGVLLGLGAVTITKEKAEQIVDELIKKGEVAKDKRPQAVQDLLNKAEEQEKALFDKITAEVNKALAKLDIPTKEDLKKLEKKIDELKKQ